MNMISRRALLKTAMAGGLVGFTNPFPTQSFTTEDLEVTHIKVTNPRIPRGFNDYRIAFVSDLHCGVFLSQNLLEKTISYINRESVDLLILGGDYIGVPDSGFARFFSYMRTSEYFVKRTGQLVTGIFQRLGSALKDVKVKDGIFAVMGNHDHWNNGEICKSTLSAFGVNILINREHFIRRKSEQILLYGTDDFWTGIPKVSSNFVSNNVDFKILISHNPDFISQTIRRNNICFDLALAGHTHGGQIYLNGIGPLGGYAVRNREFFTGTKKVGNAIVHTSRGIGVVDIPFRLNSTPEISIFTLTSA